MTGPTTFTAVLLATSLSAEGQPRATLPADGRTVVRRLLDQLASLGVGSVYVLVRPGSEASVEAACRGAGLAVTAVRTASVADDLRMLADLAASTSGTLVLGDAGVLTHREALAGLLSDPRVSSGVLCTTSPVAATETRSARGRVLSASSPFHSCRRPNGRFLDLIKVDRPDVGMVETVARRLSGLVADPPPLWEQEAERRQEDDPSVGALSLLLVGLVRSGTRVSNSYLGRLSWARPRTVEEADAAARALADVDEDRALLDSAVKSNDSFFTTFFVAPYSKFLARWCARLGLTPNLVTGFSTVLGLAAAVAYAQGDRLGLVLGAVLLQLSFTFDCVDGQLARYTRRFSRLGAWLDAFFDRGKEYAVYAGLAVGGVALGQAHIWELAAFTMVLQTVLRLFDFSWGAAQQDRIAELPHLPLEQPADVESGDVVSGGEDEAMHGIAADRPRDLRQVLRRGVFWAKRIFPLTIGERLALISITTAVGSPRAAFVAVLVWGSLAACYAMVARLVRSARMAGATAHRADPSPLQVYRDDGPLPARLGRLLPATPPVPLLTACGALALVAASVVVDQRSQWWLIAVAGVVLVVLAAPGAVRPPTYRFNWLVPGLIHAAEYVAILQLCRIGGVSGPVTYGFLAVLVFHHYDLVYRLAQQRVAPPSWVEAAGGGWPARLAFVLVVVAADVAVPAVAIATVVLALGYAAESVTSWLRFVGRAGAAPVAELEEAVP